MSDHEVAPENPQNPNPDWECNDIPIGMLIKSAIGTITVVAVSFVGAIGIFKYYDAAIDEQNEGIPAWVAERVIPEGNLLLQATPRADLAEYESNEADLLNNYGWSDAEAKVARIPIAEAKRHMLSQVFKTTSANPTDHAESAHAAPSDHQPPPHGHPDHNHATDHAPAKAEPLDAHGGTDHSEHAY